MVRSPHGSPPPALEPELRLLSRQDQIERVNPLVQSWMCQKSAEKMKLIKELMRNPAHDHVSTLPTPIFI